MIDLSNIPYILIGLVAFLLSISCHEFAHGYSAYKMGDYTAKLNGRLTLNPIKHFDAFAVIFFVLFRFGWAKGVPINPNNFKNPKHGMVYSALAGPVTNFILAFVFALIYGLIAKIPFAEKNALYYIAYYFAMFSWQMVSVNAMLAVFNLFPIPPLDGSKIFLALLPEDMYFKVLEYDRYMMIISLIVVYTGILDKFIFTGVDKLITIIETIVGVIL